MIAGKDFYNIVSALVPLYVVMILAYGAVRWWKIFTPENCAGIHRVNAMFSVPLLLFEFIANNNPYEMNQKFILADSLQKIVILLILFVWVAVSKRGSLDWVITLFSVATLPNTFIIGVPVLEAMYGEYSGGLMVQIVFLQCLVWYNVVLVLFEYRAAKMLISKKFPDRAGSISSFRVEPEVKSLNGDEAVDVGAEVDEDGNLCVTVRRSFHSTDSKSIAINPVEIHGEAEEEGIDRGNSMNHQMPSVTVLTKLILIMVWRRMIRIPNTYATVLGFIWSIVAFRFGFSMPKILSRSISIMSTTGLGLSMFSIGLYLASQTKMISCGKRVATFAMVVRFLVGPAVAAATAAAIGIRGDLLRISVVQAALPLGNVPFVFAREYDMHADIISTSVTFGLFIALPVTILYYVLMGL